MITYILESLAFQLVFLLAYDLFLKKETFFQWNRVYLLGTFALSILLPWVKIEALQASMPQELGGVTIFLTQLDGVVLGPRAEEISFLANIPWPYWVLGAGSVLASIWFAYKLIQIRQLRNKGSVYHYQEFTKVTVPKSTSAFSFFRNIFMGEEIQKDKEANILAHELVHVKQWHTLDLLFFELARIVFWFSPLAYIYQNRVAELHEFIADEKAVKHNKAAHFEMLLSEAFHTQNISFVNQFFNRSLIKKRIVMLQKNKSKAVWQLKYVLLLPLVLGMLVYTSCETNKEDNGLESVEGVSLAVANEIPFGAIDEVPVFPGCEDADDKRACFQEKMQAHIRKNFHYPEAAQEQGIQGRVSAIFRINPEGSIVDIKMRGPHELLEKETERILSKLPRMQPGKHEGEVVNVPFSIPITFRLQGNDEQEVSKQRGERLGVPFANVDEVPVFPGCEDAEDKRACFNEQIVKHIKKHFNYPKKAQDLGVQGRVSVIFVIGKDGIITDIGKRGPHELLENEAVRIIERLPKMQPGKHEGKEVKVPFSIPITFRLKKQPEDTTVNGLKDYMLVSASIMEKQGKMFYEGTVTDKESLGLAGVTISIEGESSGVVSDFNGVFSIEVDKGDVVKFQYVGLPDKRVEVSN
ncbi:TonB family protein [Flagellimonas halotolerans]|uniref:TonB family protein n=1 Tax=Flagellimonas halotolerans TaxID=3112164 RepID=A0ABU6IMA6_9FLAO|nr:MULTISPECIES: TonB family protein [unclassified Allomuricauda]MEC3964316.1 TonB family protein [Muricauda sp. SYSU M86414]MEC4264186.1 TonB family protein [Muricauda sp. SYSU M84420]